MTGLLDRLGAILSLPFYRRLAVGIGVGYLLLFLVALQDISLGGSGFQVLTTEWTRMFDRTGAITFEPIAQITLPGLTILISPLNILIGAVLAILAGLNMTVTWLALRQPKACRFNRSTGILASVPALLAGSACCAPAIVLILGLQVSSLFVTVFQVLIPVSIALLLVTLGAILRRTDPARRRRRHPIRGGIMNIKLGRAIVAGIAGTAVMTAVGLWVAPLMGMPPMNPAEMLAGPMGGNMLLGWLAHFMIGTILAVGYALVAPWLPGAPVLRGALYGIAPFLVAQIVMMPMMGMPVFSGSVVMAIGSLIGHLVYGAVVGGVYGPVPARSRDEAAAPRRAAATR